MERTISTPAQRKQLPWRRWLNYVLQVVWIVAAIYIAQLYLLSIRPGYAELIKICTEPVCPAGQLTEQGLASISRLGLSVSAYAVLRLIFVFTIAIVYATVSLLIFRAKRHDNAALYVALVLLGFGAFLSDYVDILREVQPQSADLVDILPGITLIAFTILSYVFPDGHFFPRWTVWAAWGWIIAPVILTIFAAFDAFDVAAGPVGVALLFLLATCVIAPIQRYRKLSSRTQRQQLKWVLFGLAQLLITLLVVVELLPLLFPVLDVTGSLPNILSNLFQTFSVILFPITVGIAMLRYRLWNVNMVINRTLVYVPLTSILTVIYTTSLAVSQRLFATATGEPPQAVAIFTTIVLTTTFSPIKNALQSYVDRNFKEAPEKLKELDALGEQVARVVQAFDHKSLAERVVETVMRAHNAQGAALFLYAPPTRDVLHAAPRMGAQGLEDDFEHDPSYYDVSAERQAEQVGTRKMVLAYATPEWPAAENEVSILLDEEGVVFGRLLLGQPRDREDYTLEEIEDIRTATAPIVANMLKLIAMQDELEHSELVAHREQQLDDEAAAAGAHDFDHDEDAHSAQGQNDLAQDSVTHSGLEQTGG